MQFIFDKLKNYTTVSDLKEDKATQVFSTVEEALSISTLYNINKETIIIVKDNLYHAEKLYDQLSHLSDDVYIYMSEESKRIESIASSPEFRANRLSILSILKSNTPAIIVTHTAALLRYLPSVETFSEGLITFEVDKQIDYKNLRSRLIKAGYEFSQRVDHPLTFSIRGEILDIYSINYDKPIRVEFFDTDIESIRFFDIDTQLTIDKIDKVEIIPASDILFSDSEKETIIKRLRSEISNTNESELIHNIETNIDYLENDIVIPSLYNFYAYLDKSYSLLDYTDNAKFIISDYSTIKSNEKLLNLETIEYAVELNKDNKLPLITSLWNSFDDILAKQKYTEVRNTLGSSTDYAKIHEIDIPITQFDYVMEDIIKAKEENTVVLALSESELKELEDYFRKRSIQYSREISDKNGIYLIHHPLIKGFYYEDLYVYTAYEIFNTKITVTKFSSKFSKAQILDKHTELKSGDYVVHNLYGVGKYIGIETREINGIKRDFLKIIYRNNDSLHVPLHQFSLVRKFVSRDGVAPKLNRLGTDEWTKTKEKVQASVNELAGRLVELYSNRSLKTGFKYELDEYLQNEFNNEVEFTLTNDQLTATKEILADMQSDKAMDRLLIGDVGFGKTEVSMRAAFLAIANGKQVAFLCPTTILSSQHYETFKKRFRNFPGNIQVLNRFVAPAKQKEILSDVMFGKVDILIGTHRLLSKDIVYKDLGLLIIDEEQRFGVEHKEIIKEIKQNVDVLSLSATPIPRTLQMSLVGVRQMSTLREAPRNRKPVQTYVIEKNLKTINQVIMRELARGGQVFYLHNNVKNLTDIALRLENEIEGAKVSIAHGQMSRDEIEDVMISFNLNETNILVCTTIIETGIDIPNANTIIIDKADTFGLSQLYQIRGRVGRSDQVAYAYLMYQPEKVLSEIATKRLNTIKEFTELGSGYKIAMRDLTIRGAGDMLGPQQSGFIDTVGIDMYIEMLNEAVLKAQGVKVKKQVQNKIQVNAAGHIPDKFTQFDDDKISLYQDIDKQETFKDLGNLYKEVSDYFGKLPDDVDLLFEKKRLEILLANPKVFMYKEVGDFSDISFTSEYSSTLDGIKLFTDISKINRNIKISYKNDKISLRIKRDSEWISDIMKVLEALNIEG